MVLMDFFYLTFFPPHIWVLHAFIISLHTLSKSPGAKGTLGTVGTDLIAKQAEWAVFPLLKDRWG